jgi:hypothetical protein
MKFPVEFGWYDKKKGEPRKFDIEWAETGIRRTELVVYDNITEALLALHDSTHDIGNNPEELELFLHWQDMLSEESDRDMPPEDVTFHINTDDEEEDEEEENEV